MFCLRGADDLPEEQISLGGGGGCRICLKRTGGR